MKIKKKYLILIAVVIVALVAIYLIAPSLTGEHSTVGGYDNFAKCLSENGAVMYGSEYCGHCKNQKEMFGDSFQYVNYVECTEQQELCQEKEIRFVPAWEIDGNIEIGLKTFQQLSDMTGCPLA